MTPYTIGDAPAVAGAPEAIARTMVPAFEVPRSHELGKRALDVTGAVVLLVVLSPVLLLVGVAVAATSRGPIFFGHTRIGQGGETFRCWKFRTMVKDAEARLIEVLDSCPEKKAEFAENHKLKDDPRVTSIGGFLRRSSLDELPQLVNVLLGHMSLVGPRPVVAEELPRYGEHAGHYLAVRPGVSGPWQVGGRSETTFEERVEMDVEYVENFTFWGDIKYLALTVVAVVKRVGAH